VTAPAKTVSQIYTAPDYERALLSEDPHYLVAQQRLLAEIKRTVRGPGQRILEVGGGTGLFTQKLARSFSGATVTVIEPDPEWFQVLKRRVGRFRNVVAERSGLQEFASAPQDACCASFALHHIPHDWQPAALERVAMLLRRGGSFVVLDKFIPDFRGECGRRAALKILHGYLSLWKERRGFRRGVWFELVSLDNSLARAGDYKISTRIFERQCRGHFRVMRKVKVAPLGVAARVAEGVVDHLTGHGVSVSRWEAERVRTSIGDPRWGFFVYVLRRLGAPPGGWDRGGTKG